MPVPDLGRLTKVENIRSVWIDEARDFTPWLAQPDNMAVLADTIGIELEVTAQEKQVGPFRADILCRDQSSSTDQWVLIENQLEKTDHSHLGQILTYAAGLDAVTIVWVALTFTEEHRATLDWLNEITDDRFNFFGLEIELWRIGDSPVAPKFNIASKPNNWTKRERVASVGYTDNQQKRLEFWSRFRSLLEERKYSMSNIPKPNPQNWMSFSAGRSGFYVCPVLSSFDSTKNAYGGELRMELYLASENAKTHLMEVERQKPDLEKQVGEAMTFYQKDSVKACRIYVVQPVKDIYDETKWKDYMDWLFDRLILFQKVFRPIVKNLSATLDTTVEES